jgi:hypothetical protein
LKSYHGTIGAEKGNRYRMNDPNHLGARSFRV